MRLEAVFLVLVVLSNLVISIATDAPTTPSLKTEAPSPPPVQPPTPTESPSEAPTRQSTSKPTESPTNPPPTESPSEAPTRQSTSKPTESPTNPPPTESPSQAPTSQSTSKPTESPSNRPTHPDYPSRAPTNVPTKGTIVPTNSPSTSSRQPTQSPTKKPGTKRPTRRPTRKPTSGPTGSPTLRPSPSPTTSSQPTKAPTTKRPTNPPSNSPTSLTPSTSPSIRPTTSPSTRPTITEKPSDSPTVHTWAPSSQHHADGGYCDGEFIPAVSWNGLNISALTFASLGIFVGISGGVFLVFYFDRPIIKMSQGAFLVLFCVAIATLNGGVVVLVLGEVKPHLNSCMMSFGIIEMSLVFILTALGMKEWRAWKVRVRSLKLQRVKIGNKLLYLYISLAAAIMAVLIIFWFLLEPPYPDACHDFKCSYSIWFFISWGYILMLNIATTIMAFIARDCPSVGAEASGILYVSVFILFVIVFETMFFFLGVLTPELQTLVFSFGVFWISACYVLLIVFRKFAWINLSREDVNALFLSDNKYAPSSSSHSPSNPDKTLHPLSQQGFSRTGETLDATKSSSSSIKGTSSIELSCNPADDSSLSLSQFALPPSTAVLKKPSNVLNHKSQMLPTLDEERGSSYMGDKTLDQSSQRRLSKAFKIAEKDGWQEYVDGESGESFWRNIGTGAITFSPPSMFIVQL